jgi:hypothetical protein
VVARSQARVGHRSSSVEAFDCSWRQSRLRTEQTDGGLWKSDALTLELPLTVSACDTPARCGYLEIGPWQANRNGESLSNRIRG